VVYASIENCYLTFGNCTPCERVSFQRAVSYPRALRTDGGGRAYILMGLWLPFSGAFFRATTCRTHTPHAVRRSASTSQAMRLYGAVPSKPLQDC
jgi:hypothetical protein